MWHLGAVALTAVLWCALLVHSGLTVITHADIAVLRLIIHTRTSTGTSVMRAVQHLGAGLTIRIVAWVTIGVLAVFRRFQHLLAYLAVLLAASFLETVIATSVGRMRPAAVTILGRWSGYAYPSRPTAGLALVLAGVTYTLVPAGPWRRRVAWTSLGVVALLGAARLYLATDHPTDVFTAVVIGWSLPALAYGWAIPDEAFPVSYRRRRRAHLDVGGRRGEGIRAALRQQLGLELIGAEPFGLGGSAGSTPLRLRVRNPTEPRRDQFLFAKLYATNHVRSDRLYKLVRSIRYGRLEDEQPFSSVRRLVEYEDHILRLFRDTGLPTPKPLGFIEITPEREYLIVMEYFDCAEELGTSPVGDDEIDQGLAIVRKMWDTGVAHRDIKPSNVLVCDGRLQLIDVAFAAVRPTPWRQAVDLANMMLTLTLVTEPERVYARALRKFTAQDIAEAFAASHGVTIPSQLKARLRADGRDLVGTFRRMAPPRAPVAIQRWSIRRILSTLGGAVGLGIIVWGSFVYARAAGLL